MMKITGLVLLVAISGCLAYPSGSPEEACKDGKPKHGSAIEKEASESPYHLTQDKVDFKAGDVVTVTLTTTGAPFKGFLVRSFDEQNKEIGHFENGTDSHALKTCPASTHSSNSDKTKVSLKWKAPEGLTGKVHFIGTIVENIDKYYVNLRSTHA